MGCPERNGTNIMNEYELLYIVPTQYTDDEVASVQKNVQAFIEKVGGKTVSEKSLGKIRLAYPIKKIGHGTYVLNYFDAEPANLASLDRDLRLSDEVLRHTILVRPPGALEKMFELTSYVAPLSEEARAQRREIRPAKRATSQVAPSIEPTDHLAPLPSATSPVEANMSMEELDKKIDELLDVDVTEKL